MRKRFWKSKFIMAVSISALVSSSFASVGFAQGLTLKLGDSGQQVYEAEKLLHKIGYYVEVDNYFDTYTERAVKKLQTKLGISATGLLDQATYARLKQEVTAHDAMIGKPVPVQPQPVVTQSQPQLVVTQPKPQPVVTQPKPRPVVTQPKPQPVVTQLQPQPVVTQAQPPVTPFIGDSVNINNTLTAQEQQMINLINQERAKLGLQQLQPNAKLMELARLKAKDLVDHNYFSHTSPTCGSPFQMMRAAGIVYRSAAENIAGNSSVLAAHIALMNSPGHRANILNANFNQVGIGISPGGLYGTMFVEMFTQQ